MDYFMIENVVAINALLATMAAKVATMNIDQYTGYGISL